MATLISLIIIIVIIVAMLSAAEAAIFTISRTRTRFLAEQSAAGKALNGLKEAMSEPISTLVGLASLVTIVGSVFSGIIADEVFGKAWVGIYASVLTIIIMVFADIIPKRVGERYAEQIGLIFAIPIQLISRLFRPLIFVIEKIAGPLAPIQTKSTSEEEIAFLAKVGAYEGTIEKYEEELIQRIFKLNNINAADMMTPRPLVSFIDGNKTLGEVEDLIFNAKYSRIPVYDQKPDRVVGIIYVKDILRALLQNKSGMLVREFARPPLVVHEEKLGDELLREFEKLRQHLAIVVDDHGKVVGVVGVVDILEELVGEILEEKEITPELIKRVSKNEIVVHGETQISVLNRFFNVEIPDHRTLNGYLLKKFGHLPVRGDTIETDNIKFIIEDVSPSEIEKVRVIKAE